MTASTMATTRKDYGLSAGLADPVAELVAVVGLVRDDVPGAQARKQLLDPAHVVPLAAAQVDAYRATLAVDGEVDLAAEATPRSPECPAILPPSAPAACWWALTTVESSSRCSRSGSPPRASRIRPQTPFFDQRRNRCATVFQVAEPLGQVAPGGPGPGDPDHGVDEDVIVGRAAAGVADLAREQALDELPLLGGQLVTSIAGSSLTEWLAIHTQTLKTGQEQCQHGLERVMNCSPVFPEVSDMGRA